MIKFVKKLNKNCKKIENLKKNQTNFQNKEN